MKVLGYSQRACGFTLAMSGEERFKPVFQQANLFTRSDFFPCQHRLSRHQRRCRQRKKSLRVNKFAHSGKRTLIAERTTLYDISETFFTSGKKKIKRIFNLYSPQLG
jgi:hypothetical protein